MRIRSAVCSVVLLVGLAGGAWTATSASAAKNDPCPGPGAPNQTDATLNPTWLAFDLNGNGLVCVSHNGSVTDDRLPK
jgi:hypothetical protein